jgi:hypothetical protein
MTKEEFRQQRLLQVAARMFRADTRRGWLANGCGSLGRVDHNITQQEYIERFIEQYRDHDIDKLEEGADFAAPASSLTAYERETAAMQIVKDKAEPTAVETLAMEIIELREDVADLRHRLGGEDSGPWDAERRARWGRRSPLSRPRSTSA